MVAHTVMTVVTNHEESHSRIQWKCMRSIPPPKIHQPTQAVQSTLRAHLSTFAMSISQLSAAELREYLLEKHGETAPKGWAKMQSVMRLRVVELEGEGILESAKKKKEIPPLKAMEQNINKCSRRKSDLQQLMKDEMGMFVCPGDTVEQLKIKALNHAYTMTEGHPQDFVGFGSYAHLKYQDVLDTEKGYAKWVMEEMYKENAGMKLRRLGTWLQDNVESSKQGARMNKSPTHPSKTTPKSKASPSQSSSSNKNALEDMVMTLATSVKHLTEELSEMKESQQGRRKIAGSGEITSSDWEAMSSPNEA